MSKQRGQCSRHKEGRRDDNREKKGEKRERRLEVYLKN